MKANHILVTDEIKSVYVICFRKFSTKVLSAVIVYKIIGRRHKTITYNALDTNICDNIFLSIEQHL